MQAHTLCAAMALTGSSMLLGCSASGQLTRTFWHLGPPRQFRVNSPDVAQGPYRDRWEAKQTGRMTLRVDDDLRHVTRAWLCLELWGGHPGVANKRVTVNDRTTYTLPEVGAAGNNCTYSYPQIELKLDDLVPGDNVLQFACDGTPLRRSATVRIGLVVN